MTCHDSNIERVGVMADTVHAEVARYLTEPSILQADCDKNSPTSICDPSVLRRLLLFRGFITKVKHNGLRRVTPFTLRLIATLGLEIDFFTSISTAYVKLREAGPIPSDKHLSWFSREMDAWLSHVQPEYGALISDILAHEMTIVDFRNLENEIVADPTRYTPRFIGKVLLRQYETDVLVAIDKLSSGVFDPKTDCIERRVNLIYHQAPDQSASILEVDIFLAILLSLVDGKCTIDEMARMLTMQGLPEATREAIHSVFCEAAGQGILEYEL